MVRRHMGITRQREGLLEAERTALQREESRGVHFRSDFPQRDDTHWRRQLICPACFPDPVHDGSALNA